MAVLTGSADGSYVGAQVLRSAATRVARRLALLDDDDDACVVSAADGSTAESAAQRSHLQSEQRLLLTQIAAAAGEEEGGAAAGSAGSRSPRLERRSVPSLLEAAAMSARALLFSESEAGSDEPFGMRQYDRGRPMDF